MVTELVAGAAVPLWDRELVRALLKAVEALPPDNETTWQLRVLNDDGEIYRLIVIEGAMECLDIIECFAKRRFRLAEHRRQVVVCRQIDSAYGVNHLRRLIDASPTGPH